MDYQRHVYLRFLKLIEWYSAFSSGPGVDRNTLDDAMYYMRFGNDETKKAIVTAAEAVGHVKVLEVPGMKCEVVMLTPEGHDYIFRFTRSAETGTKWDESFMGTEPQRIPQVATTKGLFAREIS